MKNERTRVAMPNLPTEQSLSHISIPHEDLVILAVHHTIFTVSAHSIALLATSNFMNLLWSYASLLSEHLLLGALLEKLHSSSFGDVTAQ